MCRNSKKNNPGAPASAVLINYRGEAHINIQCLRRAYFHRWLCVDDIRFFKPHAMFFDLGGTAKSRKILLRVHRRPVHRPPAFDISQVHRLLYDLQTPSCYGRTLRTAIAASPKRTCLFTLSFRTSTPFHTRQEEFRFFKKHGIFSRMM
jgi:hypothetical protein